MLKICLNCGKEYETNRKSQKYCCNQCHHQAQQIIPKDFPHKHILKIKWNNMKTRCYNPKNTFFKNYGGRGIIVCEEWKNSFKNFYDWSIKMGYVENSTIDRIDVNGNYEPSNCRWISMKDQCNNKTNNHILVFKNETHTLSEWAEITGIDVGTLWFRIKKNWNVDDILTKKVISKLRKIEFEGKILSGFDWDRLRNFRLGTISGRLKAGWSIEEAITTPIDTRFRNKKGN